MAVDNDAYIERIREICEQRSTVSIKYGEFHDRLTRVLNDYRDDVLTDHVRNEGGSY